MHPPSQTSIFSAKAWAISEAIFLSKDISHDKFIIFSDSKSVLDAISSPSIRNAN